MKKPVKFEVWSTHEAGDVLETSRTDEATAKQDRAIIQSTLSRNAWIREVG